MDGSNDPDPATPRPRPSPSPHSQSPSLSMPLYNSPEQQRKKETYYSQLISAAQNGNYLARDNMGYDTGKTEVEPIDECELAAQHHGNRVHPQMQPAYDPRALLNPKASTKRPVSDADSDRGRHDATQAGQISLVERLHNVQHRTASPAKRVKTEGDNSKQQPKSNISGGSTLDFTPNDGGPTAALAQSASIDLTMSDDEDGEVQVVKDNGREIICIGRVKQAYVQCHVVPYPDPRKYSGNYGQQGRIKVSFRRGGVQKTTNIIMVVDPTGREFGRVDMKTAQGLAPLMDAAKQNGLMWIATTDARRKQPNEGPPGAPLNALIALTLQLYCPRKVSHDMGKYLKTKNIFLGDPTVELNRYNYFNPQTMNHFSTREATRPEFGASYYGGAKSTPGTSYVVRSVEEIRSDVLSMFGNMVNLEDIPRRQQSPRITTSLLKHQEQALYFMLDKETEWTDEKETRKDSLYQVRIRNNGHKYYTHVITGEKRAHKPENTRGGILADEMGLGKTLSILSLVMDEESMAAGKAFALKAPPISEDNVRHQLVNSRATLLLCPLSTMVNWKTQLKDHFSQGSGPKWCYYHGSERKKFSVGELADHDLIITTYHMVAADALDKTKPLNKINWFRIVLDEAHQIRSGKSKQARGVYELAAERRWAVTGTPVQNRLEDLFALFKFLRVKPFHEVTGFNEHILGPFKAADPDVVPKLQLLVGSLTLRRLKQGNVNLPPRSDQIVRLKFSEDEQRLHEWFERDSARQVNAVTSGEKLGGHAYARILKAILYLRLISAHGRDLLGDEALKLTEGMTSENPMELDEEDENAPAMTRKAAYEMLELLDQTDMDKCQFTSCRKSVCSAEDEDEDSEGSDDDEGEQGKKNDVIGFMTPCYHIICPRHVKQLKSEWSGVTTQTGHVICQFCDARIRPLLFQLTRSEWSAFNEEREALKRDPKLAYKLGAYTGPHTKTRALLDELEKNKKESLANPTEAPIKSVIFSCWTTHLDLIQIALSNYGHTYTRLDGRMDRRGRDRALAAFANDPNIPIILVSIGAGGLGLNLTSANKVYVMEPQFNPAAEAQAVDRVHRLGQKRPVTIMRFIMEDSFEEKMLELQRKKKALADLTMAREKASKEQLAKQRLEDLRSLFR